MSQFIVCALYKFVGLDGLVELQEPLLQRMLKNDVRGTLLLARVHIRCNAIQTYQSEA